jgi:hypothetical protein
MFCKITQRVTLRLAAMLCLQCASFAVVAEGAVRIFDCNVTQVCDAAGACQPAADSITFRMAPVTLDATGAGQYLLSYGDRQELPMQAVSEIGPFLWSDGSGGNNGSNSEERNTLVISSGTQLLWHTLSLTEMPDASIRYMDCGLQQ